MKSLYEINEDVMMQGVLRPHSNEIESIRLSILVKHKKSKISKKPHFKGKTMLGLSKNYHNISKSIE